MDQPVINITSNDTQMLSIYYQDPENDGHGLGYTFDLRTTSRQNRDLIVLSIKSFAILKFYKELTNDVMDCINLDSEDDGGVAAGLRDKVILTLLETDHYKRMLYEQIAYSKLIREKRRQLEQSHAEMEEQINQTLNGYKSVLEDTEKKSTDAQMKEDIRKQADL